MTDQFDFFSDPPPAAAVPPVPEAPADASDGEPPALPPAAAGPAGDIRHLPTTPPAAISNTR